MMRSTRRIFRNSSSFKRSSVALGKSSSSFGFGSEGKDLSLEDLSSFTGLSEASLTDGTEVKEKKEKKDKKPREWSFSIFGCFSEPMLCMWLREHLFFVSDRSHQRYRYTLVVLFSMHDLADLLELGGIICMHGSGSLRTGCDCAVSTLCGLCNSQRGSTSIQNRASWLPPIGFVIVMDVDTICICRALCEMDHVAAY
jgi:hypothetical protein